LNVTSGEIAGTPSFLSPEVARGSIADARTDLYGLGCVGYWLLTGHVPFERPTAIAVAMAHMNELPIPPSERTENAIPPALETVVLACLAKDRADRPQTACEVAILLRRCEPHPQWTRDDAEKWWQTYMSAAPETTTAKAQRV